MRRQVFSGSLWEDQAGYARALRVGRQVEVSGTVSLLDGRVYGLNDAYMQTRRILEIIGDAMAELGASLQDVVRTRIYVTDIGRHAEQVGRAHAEIFGATRPVTTMVGVSALISPEFLVEIEATAIIGE